MLTLHNSFEIAFWLLIGGTGVSKDTLPLTRDLFTKYILSGGFMDFYFKDILRFNM